jgi:hypothetical protein
MSESRHEDEDDEPEDAWPEDAAEATCPWCASSVVITLDPAGGTSQEYIEDCEVCCRPWVVRVRYAEGSVDVSIDPA